MLDELLSKINDCVNELEGISEELSFEIDTTEINEAIDNLYKAYKNASKAATARSNSGSNASRP